MAKNINKKFTISLDIDTRDAEKQVESTAKNIKNALSKATKEGIGVKELREMANTINSMFEKIGQTGPLNIEQDFKGNGSAAKRIEILTNALDSLFNSMGNVNSQSISAGFMNLENVSSAAKREVDKIKTEVDKIKQLKTDLNNAKQAIDDVKSNKTDVLNNYDVEITDASIQSLISEFNVLSNAIDKGDKKSLDYYKNLLKLSQVSLKLNKAFQDVKSNDSIKQSIGSNTYSDLSLYALTKSNQAKYLLGKVDNGNIDEIIKKEESKIESIIKSDSGSALDTKDAGNNIKKHADMVADSVQYAKNKLTKAYTDYYNEVAKAKKSGVDVSPEMERIENKLYDMYDNWKISNDDQWSLQGVVDNILDGKLDANGIKRAVDTVFKDFDIKPNVSLEELESEAKQSANEISVGLGGSFDQVSKQAIEATEYVKGLEAAIRNMFNAASQKSNIEYKILVNGQNIDARNGAANAVSLKTSAEAYLANLNKDVDIDAHSHQGKSANINVDDLKSAINKHYSGLTKMSAIISDKDLVTLDLTKVKAEDAVKALAKVKEVISQSKLGTIKPEQLNNIFSGIDSNYTDIAKKWDPTKFGELAQYIYNIKQSSEQVSTPLERFKNLLMSITGGKIDFSKYTKQLDSFSTDNIEKLFNEIMKLENITEDGKLLQVDDKVTQGSIENITRDIQRQQEEFLQLRQTAKLTYEDIRAEIDKYMSTGDRSFFNKYYHPSDDMNLADNFTELADGYLDINSLTNKIAADFGIEPKVIQSVKQTSGTPVGYYSEGEITNESRQHEIDLINQQKQAHKENVSAIKEETAAKNKLDSTIQGDDAAADIARENGQLEEKLELLREIADQYGVNITNANRDRYEELNQKDMNDGLTSREEDRFSELGDKIIEADNNLEEFGATYDKITLKLANGKTKDIFPDDTGLRDLYKYADSLAYDEFNGKEIEDVIFTRKQEQEIIEQTNQGLQEQARIQARVAKEQKAASDTQSVDELRQMYDTLKAAHDALPRQKNEQPDDYTYDWSKAKDYVDFEYNGEDTVGYITDSIKQVEAEMELLDKNREAIKLTYKKIREMQNAVNKHGGHLGDDIYNEQDIERAKHGLMGLFEMYDANGGNLDALDIKMTKPFQTLLETTKAGITARKAQQKAYDAETKDIIANNREQIESFEKLYNTTRDAFEASKSKDKKYDHAWVDLPDIYGDINYGSYSVGEYYDSFESNLKRLGIEIPQAAEKAKQAIKEVDNTKADPKVDLSTKNELQEIEKQAEKTDTALEELDRQKVSTDVKGDKKGDTKTAVSDDTSKEAQQLEMLDAKLKEVKAAIEAKTQAFREEENIVTAAIGTEVNALNSLESHLESSTQSARAMGSALKDASDLSSVSSSETVSDNKIQDEINALDQLQLKLKEVKSAIEAKTQAFREGSSVANSAIDSEINALNQLQSHLNSIEQSIKSMADALRNVPDQMTEVKSQASDIQKEAEAHRDNYDAIKEESNAKQKLDNQDSKESNNVSNIEKETVNHNKNTEAVKEEATSLESLQRKKEELDAQITENKKLIQDRRWLVQDLESTLDPATYTTTSPKEAERQLKGYAGYLLGIRNKKFKGESLAPYAEEKATIALARAAKEARNQNVSKDVIRNNGGDSDVYFNQDVLNLKKELNIHKQFVAEVEKEQVALRLKSAELDKQIQKSKELARVQDESTKNVQKNEETKNIQKDNEIVDSKQKDVEDQKSYSKDQTQDVNTLSEIQQLEKLDAKLQEVKLAIEAKTQEFKDEGRIVDGVVDKEIAALNNLSTYLDTIRLNAKSVADSLNQINNTKLNAPTGAVSNNNIDNVHYVTDPQGNKVTMYRGIRGAYGGLVSNRYHGGTFSTDDLNLAKTYAGFTGKVEKVNLSMKNPLEINAKGAYWNQIEYIGNQFDDISRELHTLKENILDAQHSMHFLAQDSDEYQKLQKEMQDNQARVDSIYADPNNPYGITDTNKIVEHAKSTGHDGVIFKNIVDTADSSYYKEAANVMVTFGQDQIHYLDTIQSTFTSAISRFKDKYGNLAQYVNFSKEDVAREMEYARGLDVKNSDERTKTYSEHPFIKDFADFRFINGIPFKEYNKIYNDTADDAFFEEMSKRTYNDIFGMRYELTSIAKAFGKENIPFNELLSKNIDSVAEDQSNQKSTSNDKEVLPDNKWALDSTLSTTNSILQSILTAVNGSDSTDQISKVLDGAVLDLKAAADALRTSANEVKQESKKGTKSKPKDDKSTISKKIGKEDELTFDEIKNNEISNFEKYKKDVENSIHATDQFKNKLSELELQLKDVNDIEGLNTWKQNVEKFQGAFGIHESANKKQLIGEINAINKDAKDAIKGLDLNELSDDTEKRAAQERIIQGFKEIQIASDICTNSVKKNQYDEISAFNAAKQQLAEKKKQLLEEAAIYRQQYGFMNGGKSGKNYGSTAVMRETTRYNKFKQYASDENQGFKDSTLFNEKLQQYINAYDRLIAKRQEISNKSVRTDRDEQEFNDAKQAAADYGKEIDRLIAKSHKLETGAYQIGSIGSDINIESGLSRKQALTDFVTQMHNAKESTIQFADNYQKCTFKMKNEDGTWTRMTAHLDKFSNKMYSTAGEVTKYGSAFGEFVGALKGEFLKLGRYMIASFGIEEVIQAVRTGIGYVKEIDDALTDLKKVTNETDAGYERFLQTMSKTAAVVGSTVAELTTMAAEWARLGYSMQQAADLAESTAILLNVSEFEDPTEASEALISTIQANINA